MTEEVASNVPTLGGAWQHAMSDAVRSLETGDIGPYLYVLTGPEGRAGRLLIRWEWLEEAE